MATKSKKARKSAKKSTVRSFEKKTPQFYKNLAAGFNKGKTPDTSGELIRARIVEGKKSVDEIVSEVHKKFKDATTAPSDVYWQRGRLKKEGIKLDKMPGSDKPAAKKPAAKKASKKPAKKAKKAATKKAAAPAAAAE